MSETYLEKMERAKAPKRHLDFRPHDSTSELWNETYAKVKEKISNGGLVSLLGTRGSGKTQMAVCCMGYMFNSCYNARYTKAFDIFLSIRNGNNPKSLTTEQEEIGKYYDPHLLVIDAFEVRGDTAFEDRTLNHIIDVRYDRLKPTIIISNDSKEAYFQAVGSSIMSRTEEGGGIFILSGESHRRK